MLIPSGPRGNHLFGIVTEACPQGQHILLSVSTIREGAFHDPTCVIAPGEHSFVNDPSWVVYRDARIEHSTKLTRMVDSGYYRTHDDLSDDLVIRMLDGIGISPHTPRHVIRYCDDL